MRANASSWFLQENYGDQILCFKCNKDKASHLKGHGLFPLLKFNETCMG